MIAPADTIAGMIATQGPLGDLTAHIGDGSPLGPVERWSPALISTVRLMLSSKAEIVLFWGPELCALYNEAYAPTIGDKHPAALGRPARENWAELWDDLEPLLLSVVQKGETVHAKDRPFYIERDGGRGEQVYFDISYSPVFEADGSIGGALCIVNETTQRVKAEREMVADRNRLWTLARDPFLIADMEGKWLSASPAWTDILGWSQEELIGRTSEWMEHPDDSARTREEVQTLQQGVLTIRFENRFRTKDGDYRSFSWTAVPDNGLVYCVARDVTEQRAHARALAETEAALRQAQKMETLGQLTGGVAHDFNNLLQVVTGNLELLQRGLNDNERMRRAADNAMAGAERAAMLTQQLLAFSRRQPLAPERVDPNRLVSRMSELLNRTLGERIEVETIQAARAWPIEVDLNQMENALLNLAVNARDAMPDGGKLTIEVANTHIDDHYAAQEDDVQPGQYVLICLSDTGQGMDAETLSHAIEPFFTTKEVGRGTGLGLSMVYGFIKQSGGHIRVYSEVGEGTSVKIYLPRYHGLVPANDQLEEVPRPAVSGGDETVLVCEDDEKVRAYAVEVLNELGYHVIEAGNGPAALEALEQPGEHIDLLFTDVVLPGGMTGADVAREAAARRPDIKILFATGYARNAIFHHGRLDPGVELLTKPFTYADLAGKVREVLDRRIEQRVG
ncbi:PAS domain S-box protein [Sphingomonadales bacterium 56]|uniref:hybrid sensor histidine kinase/response regulator n=1 Tax=unclassified Sphingobium TaxID=2611147 RepID=UPI00191AA404|nr:MULTISPECIES: PAS domain S-box protein [unclassified Sphingobium]MBY2928259.1 PAS domain S-box protein [Sphingomonadales bacterium 56]MBY2958359.1 PAS domain S-box protein [Sphingomonadales bacterium 58]CAD7336894.1 Sensor histidine kinase RcsC [Sphingobium sp. S6]CAD7336951.1 Sensor histidine kinase RcsC [Sphingobium sp. S8]